MLSKETKTSKGGLQVSSLSAQLSLSKLLVLHPSLKWSLSIPMVLWISPVFRQSMRKELYEHMEETLGTHISQPRVWVSWHQ